ncbi:hypothetical protein BZG36_03666 [Bifiguratus adelaidae]|uniref:BZIP domain-containing protein n=1 Tax=Bifiguratus adelaidae TaxID=1938954 RepID=A0A261XZT4_9FUNG|nr:hypothetical protein BZG36_03666 [Bifiguratus adelaidae]
MAFHGPIVLDKVAIQQRLSSLVRSAITKIQAHIPNSLKHTLSQPAFASGMSEAGARTMFDTMSNTISSSAYQPSFINFFVSSYFMVLVFLSLVMNRIHAIVTPQVSTPLPFFSRLAVRIPSLFFLIKSSFHLSAFLLNLYNIRQFSVSLGIPGLFHLYKVVIPIPRVWREGALAIKGQEILWGTFKAMSSVTVIETFCNCAERRPLAQEHTVSLFEWSLVLYFTTGGNEILHIALIQTLQLLALQLLYLHPRGHNYKLIPTTFFGIVAQIHFVYSVLTASNQYPSLHFLARLPEFVVMCIIVLSCGIHLCAMCLSCNFRRQMFDPHGLPSLNEDFAVAIFKVCSACLEATNGIGFRNEAEGIRAVRGTVVDRCVEKWVNGVAVRGRRPSFPTTSTSRKSFEPDFPDDMLESLFEREIVDIPPSPDEGVVSNYRRVRLDHLREFWRNFADVMGKIWSWMKKTVSWTRSSADIVQKAEDDEGENEETAIEQEDVWFQQFLRNDPALYNEEASEDDWIPWGVEEDLDQVDDDASSDDEMEEQEEEQEEEQALMEETVHLAMDLNHMDDPPAQRTLSSFFSTPQPSPSLLSIFVTHTLHPAALTRRRFQRLTTTGTQSLFHLIQHRRTSAPTPTHCPFHAFYYQQLMEEDDKKQRKKPRDPSIRALQNRTAQRLFRERKANYVKELETKLAQAEKDKVDFATELRRSAQSLVEENGRLKTVVLGLQRRNEELEQRVSGKTVDGVAACPTCSCTCKRSSMTGISLPPPPPLPCLADYGPKTLPLPYPSKPTTPPFPVDVKVDLPPIKLPSESESDKEDQQGKQFCRDLVSSLSSNKRKSDDESCPAKRPCTQLETDTIDGDGKRYIPCSTVWELFSIYVHTHQLSIEQLINRLKLRTKHGKQGPMVQEDAVLEALQGFGLK